MSKQTVMDIPMYDMRAYHIEHGDMIFSKKGYPRFGLEGSFAEYRVYLTQQNPHRYCHHDRGLCNLGKDVFGDSN